MSKHFRPIRTSHRKSKKGYRVLEEDKQTTKARKGACRRDGWDGCRRAFGNSYNFKMMLQKGSEGFDVILMQAKLRREGFPNLRINGEFDSQTQATVQEFQKSRGLSPDGIFGSKSSAELDKTQKNAWLFYFLHCSATKEGDDLGGDWVRWLHQTKNGWSRPGYPDVIRLNGQLDLLWKFDQDQTVAETEYTFGVKSQTLLNRNSIHLCYIGGLSSDGSRAKDTRTDAQKKAMQILINWALLRNPWLVVVGHNQVQKKACPSFDVPTYLRSIQVPEANIANWSNKFRI